MKVKLLHPSVALIYYAGLLTFVFLYVHPIYRAVTVLGIFFLACMYNGIKKTMLSLRFLLPTVLLLGLINPLFVHRGATILFYLFDNPVTLEAVVYGTQNAVMMLCVILFFFSFNRVIDQAAFLYLTSSRLPRVAFMTDMALRASARFRVRLLEMTGVQETRGISITRGNTKTRMQSALTLLGAFTVRSLEEGMETAEVLKARDYGTVKRSAYRFYPFCARDIGSMGILIVLLCIIMNGYLHGTGRYLFYPRLQPLSLTHGDMLIIYFYTIYVFIPILYEGSGFITRKWNRYVH